MKRFCILFLSCVLLFGGCSNVKYADVTPDLKAIEGVCFQRTNVDENNTYTYFEKTLSDPDEIVSFCKKIDKIKLETTEPTKFSSVDYLIVFQGKKEHKLYISGNEVIYDGLAYKLSGLSDEEQVAKPSKLGLKFQKIYEDMQQQESAAQSKLFK